MNKFIVIRDSRERVGYWNFSFLPSCQKQIVKKLQHGDYCIAGLEKQLYLERKRSVTEFVANLGSRWATFERALNRMQNHKYKYILLEFTINDILNFPRGCGLSEEKIARIKMNAKYILSRIEFIKNKYGITIIYCRNREDAQAEAAHILERVYALEIGKLF